MSPRSHYHLRRRHPRKLSVVYEPSETRQQSSPRSVKNDERDIIKRDILRLPPLPLAHIFRLIHITRLRVRRHIARPPFFPLLLRRLLLCASILVLVFILISRNDTINELIQIYEIFELAVLLFGEIA